MTGSIDGRISAHGMLTVAMPVLAFLFYCGTSYVLEARQATTHFGADSWYYAELAGRNVLARTVENSELDRIMRFHPVTAFLAIGWMETVGRLLPFVPSLYVLKLLFSASGAASVWASMRCFLRLLPQRDAIVFAALFAVSFSSLYFASVEESKIVTAAMAGFYFAVYLRLREEWSVGRALLLTIVLLVACLNEMVSIFLVAVPAIDVLLRYGFDFKRLRWIFVHALAGPIAFLLIEGVMHGHLVAATHPEGSSHFGMFLAYVTRNRYDGEAIYNFLVNWVFFNIAAPSSDASYGVAPGANYHGHSYKGYFEPALSPYLRHPASIPVAVLGLAIASFTLPPRYRGTLDRSQRALIAGLLTYSVVRAVFFFLFNPLEPLLFTPAITLAHLLLLAIFVDASRFPYKHALVLAFAVAAFVANAAFMVGWG